MKVIVFFLAALILFTPVISQEHVSVEQLQSKFSQTHDLHSKPNFSAFDRKSGMMHLHASPGYVGSSIAYVMKGSERFLYGFHLDVMSTGTVSNTVNGFYASESFSQTTLIVPFWLSMKLRLYQDPNSSVSPYIIVDLARHSAYG